MKIKNQKSKIKYQTLGSKQTLIANSSKLKASAGFTLLFASLIGSLVFTIGIAILNISLKQMALSNAGRESQQAFYSADAGVECALFLDRGAGDRDCQTGFFAISSSTAATHMAICDKDSNEYLSNSKSPSQKCFGKDIDINPSLGAENSTVNRFEITDNTDTDICFSVTVTKIPNSIDATDIKTIIDSRGYNTCSKTGNVYERAIKTFNY